MFSKKTPSQAQPVPSTIGSYCPTTRYEFVVSCLTKLIDRFAAFSGISQPIIAGEMPFQPQPVDSYAYSGVNYSFYPMNYGSYYGGVGSMPSTTATPPPTSSVDANYQTAQSYIPPHMYVTASSAENSTSYVPKMSPNQPLPTTEKAYNDVVHPTSTENPVHSNVTYDENETTKFSKY